MRIANSITRAFIASAFLLGEASAILEALGYCGCFPLFATADCGEKFDDDCTCIFNLLGFSQPLFNYICTAELCCDRRRKLTADETHTGTGATELGFSSAVDRCGSAQYETSVYVGSPEKTTSIHMFLVAAPLDAPECPYLTMHSNFGPNGPEKEALVWTDKTQGEAKFTNEMFPIGTFQLQSLAEAFDKVEMKDDLGMWEVLHNNCANLLVDIAGQLGATLDAEATTNFVTRKLLEHDDGGRLIQAIKDSTHYVSFFGGRNLLDKEMTDDQLVAALVHAHVQRLM